MKLLILSDSHGEQEFMQLAVRRERPDAVIHLGDHCADADRLAEEFCGLPGPERPRQLRPVGPTARGDAAADL